MTLLDHIGQLSLFLHLINLASVCVHHYYHRPSMHEMWGLRSPGFSVYFFECLPLFLPLTKTLLCVCGKYWAPC